MTERVLKAEVKNVKVNGKLSYIVLSILNTSESPMSTHAVTKFLDDDDSILCAFYTHYDGYPTGHGADLVKFLQGFDIVNGLGSDRDSKPTANGVGCLAAQAIKHFKDGSGHTYMCRTDDEEQYVYLVKADEGEPIHLTVIEDGKVLWEGALQLVPQKLLSKR